MEFFNKFVATLLIALTPMQAMADAVIFSGSDVKTLKSNIDLNGAAKILSGATDPTSSAVSAPIGSMYMNSSNSNLYQKIDAGSSTNWKKLSVGGDGGTNYISNPGAEVASTGWTMYDDGAAAASGTNTPVDATGGSPSSTWTRTTTVPLRGVGAYLYTHSANNRQGEGVSIPFTIDQADQGKVLAVTFDYKNVSGTFFAADGITAPSNSGTTTQNAGNSDLEVFVYDVTNSALVPVSPQVLPCTSTVSCSFKGVFQTPSNSTSFRFAIHNSRSGTTAFVEQFDNFFVGPQSVSYGSAITDWTSYTMTVGATSAAPTLGTSGTVTAFWRRVGDSAEIRVIVYNPNAGSAGTGNYLFPLPTGLVLDTAKATVTTNASGANGTALGHGYAGSTLLAQTSNSFQANTVVAYNTTNLELISGWSTVAQTQGYGASFMGWNGASYAEFTASVPIAGWSSTVQMSNDTDTRVVAARYTNSASQTLTNSTDTLFEFATKVFDTHGAVTAAPFKFTAPISGLYYVKAALTALATTEFSGGTESFALTLYKNGSSYSAMAFFVPVSGSTNPNIQGSSVISLVAGDYIDVRANQASGGNINSGTNTQYHYIEIFRLSGPSAIAATDTVSALYTGAGPTGTLNGSFNIATFGTKVKDSHNAYSSGTYTVPSPGSYSAQAFIDVNAVSFTVGQYLGVSMYINGTEKYTSYTYSGGTLPEEFASLSVNSVPLLAGDLVTIRTITNATTPTYNARASTNYFSIVRTGN